MIFLVQSKQLGLWAGVTDALSLSANVLCFPGPTPTTRLTEKVLAILRVRLT